MLVQFDKCQTETTKNRFSHVAAHGVVESPRPLGCIFDALFYLWLYVPVNSYGHARMFPFHATSTQHLDDRQVLNAIYN